MSDQTISCPHCQRQIQLTETLTLQIESKLRADFELKAKSQADELARQTKELTSKKQELENEQKLFTQTIEDKLKIEKEKMWTLAQAKAAEKINLEIKDLQSQKAEREKQLEAAQKNELELRAKTRDLEEKTKNMDLELQRKIDEERKKLEEQMQRHQATQLDERLRIIQEEFRKKELEKDKQMEILKRSLDEAQRKSEQASMQIQGEIQEEDLKYVLQHNFPIDVITDVPTGINGADLVQTVNSSFGQKCGIILWESKNTKQWSNDWVKKLKTDQGNIQADICLLVTRVLPDGIKKFGNIDGVWVLDAAYVIPLTVMVRSHLLQLHQAKNSLVGREEKKDFLYRYVSSSQFKNRLESIIMGFSSLKQDLESEKRAMQRIWSKREKEIERVIMNTTGIYGDMQGIIGASLPNMAALELGEDSSDEEKDGSSQRLL